MRVVFFAHIVLWGKSFQGQGIWCLTESLSAEWQSQWPPFSWKLQSFELKFSTAGRFPEPLEACMGLVSQTFNCTRAFLSTLSDLSVLFETQNQMLWEGVVLSLGTTAMYFCLSVPQLPWSSLEPSGLPHNSQDIKSWSSFSLKVHLRGPKGL